MDRSKTVIGVVAGSILLIAIVIIVRGTLGSSPGSRGGAIREVQAALSTDDLIAKRADLILMIEGALEDPATLPERLDSVKRNLAGLEDQLRERGVDVASLQVQPSWAP